jgi:hypothetical protein
VDILHDQQQPLVLRDDPQERYHRLKEAQLRLRRVAYRDDDFIAPKLRKELRKLAPRGAK